MVMNELELKERTLNEVRDIFESADPTGNGQMSLETFQNQVFDNPRMQVLLQKIGVDMDAITAKGLFKLLDFRGHGIMSIGDFMTSIQLIKGNARSIDLARLSFTSNSIAKKVDMLLEFHAQNGLNPQELCRSKSFVPVDEPWTIPQQPSVRE